MVMLPSRRISFSDPNVIMRNLALVVIDFTMICTLATGGGRYRYVPYDLSVIN
jgi:hypothetical protein